MSDKNLYQRMSAVVTAIPTVAKNLTVDTGKGKGYKAVSETDILDAVREIEAQNGIYSYPYSRQIIETDVLETENQYGKKKQLFLRVEVVYRFVNVDNPTEYIDVTSYGDGIDSGDKATGKAMTYADKYALMKAYKIRTGDDPDKEASPELLEKRVDNRPCTVDQVTAIAAYPERVEKLKAYYGVTNIQQLTREQAKEAIAMLKRGK